MQKNYYSKLPRVLYNELNNIESSYDFMAFLSKYMC